MLSFSYVFIAINSKDKPFLKTLNIFKCWNSAFVICVILKCKQSDLLYWSCNINDQTTKLPFLQNFTKRKWNLCWKIHGPIRNENRISAIWDVLLSDKKQTCLKYKLIFTYLLKRPRSKAMYIPIFSYYYYYYYYCCKVELFESKI